MPPGRAARSTAAPSSIAPTDLHRRSVVQQPPVYTERQEVAPEAQGYWYYCAATRGYYPYVKECPGGWQKVPPAPPPG